MTLDAQNVDTAYCPTLHFPYSSVEAIYTSLAILSLHWQSFLFHLPKRPFNTSTSLATAQGAAAQQTPRASPLKGPAAPPFSRHRTSESGKPEFASVAVHGVPFRAVPVTGETAFLWWQPPVEIGWRSWGKRHNFPGDSSE